MKPYPRVNVVPFSPRRSTSQSAKKPFLGLLLGACLCACGLDAGELSLTTSEKHDRLSLEGGRRLPAECFDTLSCCPERDLECRGNPDEQIRCECRLWACEGAMDERCWRALPRPPGATIATCTWDENAYECRGSTSAGGLPATTDGWTCASAANGWRCTAAFPPNPSDGPAGVSSYACQIDEEFERLVCLDVSAAAREPEPSQAGNNVISPIGQSGTATEPSVGASATSPVVPVPRD